MYVMFYSEEEKEKMKVPQFKFPEWQPESNLEIGKWIKEFKKINHLDCSIGYQSEILK